MQLTAKMSDDLSKTMAKSKAFQNELQDKRRENQELANLIRDKVHFVTFSFILNFKNIKN